MPSSRTDGPEIVLDGREYPRVREIFGSLVFDKREMMKRLPKEVFEHVDEAMDGRRPLESSDAEVVAMAMRDWAISHGATHWTHWFHPLNENTAEKHMAFTFPSDEGVAIEQFRAKDLMQGEPDASSFPNAGRRSTFEARGYSAWDISSSAFIVKTPKGGTLCIPSIFISYDGTPLDLKTGLHRSLTSIEDQSMKLLRLLGQRGVKNVKMTVGSEQEYFLIDRPRAQHRPDIRFCSRTLIGAQPAKDQKLDHHYFGAIPPRVLAYMEDVERDLARLGVTISTRHNEVARCQFEFAPLFAEANIACDQNMIIMETMRKLARKHELRLLFHEKPFAAMNGSGKHVNFSLVDSEGRNLLKPSSNNRKNVVFLAFLASLVYGVSRHFTLLQAVTATAGNMYRLGGHEAPPSIISVYLGSALTNMINEIENGSAKQENRPAVDLGMAKLATITPYDSDRNRTSPVAFTGDKFEFRAPGASQAVAMPVSAIAAIWSWGIKRFCAELDSRADGGKEVLDAAVEIAIDLFHKSEKILFEGDAYTHEWELEADRRGLIRSRTIPEAIDLFLEPSTVEMLEEMGIYSRREIEVIHDVRMEAFCTAIEVEMSTMGDMLNEGILPAISRQIVLERSSLDASGISNEDLAREWREMIEGLGRTKALLIRKYGEMCALRGRLDEMDASTRARAIVQEAVPLMDEIRAACDGVEHCFAEDIQPYPIYRNLLSLSM